MTHLRTLLALAIAALAACHKTTPPGAVVFDADLTPPRNLSGVVGRPGTPTPDGTVRFKNAELAIHALAGTETGSGDRHLTHARVVVAKNDEYAVEVSEVPHVTPVCLGASPAACVAELRVAWTSGGTTVTQSVHLGADGSVASMP